MSKKRSTRNCSLRIACSIVAASVIVMSGCHDSHLKKTPAPSEQGFDSLFNGDNLNNWKLTPELSKHWQIKGDAIAFDGTRGDLWTAKSYENFELLIDWRWVGESQGPRKRQLIEPDGSYRLDTNGNQLTEEIEERDSGIYLRGNSKSQVNIWEWPAGSGEVWGYRTDASMPSETRAAATPKFRADRPVTEWNRFRIKLVGETLNVHLNGKHVIVDCKLPGVPASGPLGLQAHGSAIEFKNIWIRPL